MYGFRGAVSFQSNLTLILVGGILLLKVQRKLTETSPSPLWLEDRYPDGATFHDIPYIYKILVQKHFRALSNF